jgi:hypothetical protein
MRLKLIAINLQDQILQFSMVGTKDEEYALLKELPARVRFHNHPMELHDKSSVITITKCQSAAAVSVLLVDIQKICERNQVVNWDEFVDQINTQLDIKVEIKPKTLNHLYDALFKQVGQYLSINEMPAYLQTSYTINHAVYDPKKLLKTHFPHYPIHQTLQPFLPVSERKKPNIFQQTFNAAYREEYEDLSAEDKLWMSRFKTGDSTMLNDNNVIIKLISLKDANDVLACTWAFRNGHQTLLNAAYRKAIEIELLSEEKASPQENDQTDVMLMLAMSCHQPKKTIKKHLKKLLKLDDTDAIKRSTWVHEAIRSENIDAINLFTKVGVSTELARASYHEPAIPAIVEAAATGKKEILCALAKTAPAPQDVLHRMIDQNISLERLRFAMSQISYNLNYVDPAGYTALGLAAKKNNSDLFEYLCTQPNIDLQISNASHENVLYQLVEKTFLHYRATKRDMIKILCAQPQIVFGYLNGQPLFDERAPQLTTWNHKKSSDPQAFLYELLHKQLSWSARDNYVPGNFLEPLKSFLSFKLKKPSTMFALFHQPIDLGILLISNMLFNQQDSPPALNQLIRASLAIIDDKEEKEKLDPAYESLRRTLVWISDHLVTHLQERESAQEEEKADESLSLSSTNI